MRSQTVQKFANALLAPRRLLPPHPDPLPLLGERVKGGIDVMFHGYYSVCRKFFPQRGVNGHYTNRSREQVL